RQACCSPSGGDRIKRKGCSPVTQRAPGRLCTSYRPVRQGAFAAARGPMITSTLTTLDTGNPCGII
ncbi:hypothetical protein MJO24_23425, partial [Salmonella enterica subsp. enterica serovar Lubbock]|nr:hypothetical protein [Salmonella enterica subsp. enterica serovar Lubbock]